MSESDVLLTIAEVAVAFAGFASLVGVLGQRSSADRELVRCYSGGLPDGAGGVAFSVRIRFLSYRFFVLASGRNDWERA